MFKLNIVQLDTYFHTFGYMQTLVRYHEHYIHIHAMPMLLDFLFSCKRTFTNICEMFIKYQHNVQHVLKKLYNVYLMFHEYYKPSTFVHAMVLRTVCKY